MAGGEVAVAVGGPIGQKAATRSVECVAWQKTDRTSLTGEETIGYMWYEVRK